MKQPDKFVLQKDLYLNNAIDLIENMSRRYQATAASIQLTNIHKSVEIVV